jgi:N-acetylglucosaminyl-diphospho-decaprenol L-rhamnosyltransferase
MQLPSRLWIVIVNYRTAPLVLDCLSSLAQERQHYSDLKVTVVENASGDGSVEALQQGISAHQWQDWVHLEALSHNGGFGAGNNVVLRQVLSLASPPEYILLLNPDTRVLPGAIAPLIQFLEDHPQVGLVGSRLEDSDGTPQFSAFRFLSFWSELDQGLRLGPVSRLLKHQVVTLPLAEEPFHADWLAGASLMIRREVLESVGLFDEAYFLYFEEVDFCRRAKQAGWDCWYVPQSRVVHLVGQSTGVTDSKCQLQRRPQYWFDSRRRYFLKHHRWTYAASTDLAWMVGFSLWQLRRWIQGRPEIDPPHLLQDFFRNSLWGRGNRS